MSIIEEGYEKQVRMAHLCIVGSHSVNGVSALHSNLLVKSLVPEFAQIWPEKFNNKTNGVAPRRWLMKANPGSTDLISHTLDEQKWITDLSRLRELEPWADDKQFRAAFKEVKRQNKLQAGRRHSRPDRSALSIPIPSSTCRSSGFTNTSASCWP